jgi:hypothetical protein
VGDRTVDFLKIDVEGHEQAVIRGADWERYRPRIVLVEDHNRASWEPLLLAAGYLFASGDGINRYYVRAEEPALLQPLRRPAVMAVDDYIPFRYHRIIEQATAEAATQAQAVAQAQEEIARRQAEIERLTDALAGTEEALAEASAKLVGTSPLTLRLARALHSAARRHPRLAKAARHLLAG